MPSHLFSFATTEAECCCHQFWFKRQKGLCHQHQWGLQPQEKKPNPQVVFFLAKPKGPGGPAGVVEFSRIVLCTWIIIRFSSTKKKENKLLLLPLMDYALLSFPSFKFFFAPLLLLLPSCFILV